MLRPCALLLCLIGMVTTTSPQPASAAEKAPAEMLVYIGTRPKGAADESIFIYRLKMDSGRLERVGAVSGVKNPSFLAIHPNQKFLYSVSEVDGDGSVTAFAIDASTGLLTQLNHQSSGGAGPCHLVVDRSGSAVLVANYQGGSVACLPLNKDGTLREMSAFVQHEGSSVNERRQGEPHAHSINVDLGNRFAMAADLGTDDVFVYRFDPAKGSLTANDPVSVEIEPGSGPRHFAFHPNARNAYVINELASTITALKYDAERGVLKALQTISTLPKDFKGDNTTAEVQVHPSGKFVYGSNRGHDSIAVFAVDESTGKLKRVENESTQGSTPRNFGIDPTGTYLLAANQATGNVVVMRIDAQSGKLSPTGESIEVPAPMCVKFLPVQE